MFKFCCRFALGRARPLAGDHRAGDAQPVIVPAVLDLRRGGHPARAELRAQQGDEVRAGVDYLLATQRPDGDWAEDQFTGTGFPKVFYLKYHMYSLYFPLMALARYRVETRGQKSEVRGQRQKSDRSDL